MIDYRAGQFGRSQFLILTMITAGLGVCGISLSRPLHAQTADIGVNLAGTSQSASRVQSNPLLMRLSFRVESMPLNDALRKLATTGNLKLTFGDEVSDITEKVSVNAKDQTVESILTELLKGTKVRFRTVDPRQIFLFTDNGTKKQDKGVGVIQGSVSDSVTNSGITGVNISIPGTVFSTQADSKGNFSLKNIPSGEHVIMFRVLGFLTTKRTVKVEEGKVVSLNVVMKASASTLTEVVTTATGKQRRVDISNDVVKVDAAKLMEAAPVRSVTDLLQAAQINGVVITPSSGEPGAPKRIRIGGVGSISQNNDPVVIIDGVWVKSDFSTQDVARQLGGQAGYGGYLPSRLDALDPNTIETIEVVRGPAAATLYGPDAANGVILITTKRGSVGPARWDFHYSHDRKAPSGKHPLSYQGFGHTPFSDEPTRCTALEVANQYCTQDSLVIWSDAEPLLKREGTGSVNLLSASVNGGTRQVRYNLTAGLSDQAGTRRLNEIAQARGRLLSIPIENRYINPSRMRDRRLSTRIDLSPREGLDFSLSLEGSQQNSNEDAFNLAFGTIGVYDSMIVTNTTGTTTLEKKGSRTTRGLVSLVTRWNPTSWSLFSTTFGIDKEVQREVLNAELSNCNRATCAQSSVKEETAGRDASVYTIRAQSSFTPSLGRADRFIRIQPGVTFDLRRQVNYRHSALIERFADSTTLRGDFLDGPTNAIGGVSLNANIRLFDRISFDPAIRHDFSGAKELQNNSKSYPRFGTSWLVSEEPFFPQSEWFSTLRLRGAFGYAAVQPKLSQLYGRYSLNNANISGTSVPVIRISAVGNPNLQPERSSEIEVGFDADMFHERIMLTLTYANKQNRNTLIDRPLASSAGVIEARQENIAKVVNQSTMIQVIARPIERDNFRVRLTSNIAFSHNEIKSLGSGVSPYGTFEQRYVEGYPVGGLWSRQVLGVIDANNDGFIDQTEMVFTDSFAYMGSNMPRYTMGHNIEVGFLSNFTFNAFIDYKGPFTQNRAIASNSLRGYWDPNSSREEQMIPIIMTRLGSGGNKDLQTVRELRLQSASISMNVPMHIVRRLGAQSVHVSLQGSNLGLWSQYRGRDPGINSSPIGERLTDASNTIGLTRNYSLQFRVRY